MRVQIKRSNQLVPLDVNTAGTGLDFKQVVYQATGVPPDRMKVMVKGGMLKDIVQLDTLGWKEDQIITVIGTSGPLPEVPQNAPQFVEDLDQTGARLEASNPAGLFNLGQTCYLNSGIQMLRSIRELPVALKGHNLSPTSSETRLASSVLGTLTSMSKASQPIIPVDLLNNLRTLAPQFAERDAGGNFAQQDADEAWTQIITSLRSAIAGEEHSSSLIDDIMGVKLITTQKCLDNPDEQRIERQETVLKLQCNISITTNFLLSGIQESLNQEVEKNSPSLNRMAMYQHQSRLMALPQYLTIHMVRFYWRRDIQKKAKIMRKVKFPLLLDVADLMTDDLRTRTRSVHSTVKRIIGDRDDRIRHAKNNPTTDAHQREELGKRALEREEVAALSSKTESKGMSGLSGLYELCGMVTHKGASADSGHYIGWALQDQSMAPLSAPVWHKFDDDKVSSVDSEKILALDGGGEDSVAYLLMYRSVQI